MPRPALFRVLLVALCLALTEICAGVVWWAMRADVDPAADWQASLGEAEYRAFLESAYDPVTGWRHPAGRFVEENCLGQDVVNTSNDYGARVHPGEASGPVRIIAVGDSFTRGGDIGDADTFPAQLEALLGVAVANHGKSGGGPLQALLTLERVLEHYPEAHTVVFAIMHEGLLRMVNSFRPVLNTSAGSPYGFKPFVRDRRIHANPNAPPVASMAEVEALGLAAFREDFWSRGEWEFPFFLSWVRFLRSDYFRFELHRGVAVLQGSAVGYEVYYSSERLRADLHFVIDRFYDLAKSRGLRPIVVFIPRKPGDQHSADRMVAELRERFPSSELPVLALGRMTELDIDWSRFNLVPGHCHPSRYGQGMVARAIAAEIGL